MTYRCPHWTSLSHQACWLVYIQIFLQLCDLLSCLGLCVWHSPWHEGTVESEASTFGHIYFLLKLKQPGGIRGTARLRLRAHRIQYTGPISSTDHVLVRINISLAILRVPPQHRQFWQFARAYRRGLQAAISLEDWFPGSAAPDINSSTEICFLSLMHISILSRLLLPSPSHHPWYMNPEVRQLPWNNLPCLPG